MNTSVYLFGELSRGYTQYPDDHTASIFRNFSANTKAVTQVAIHRDGNLVYYGYIRKLEEAQYLGLCVVLNGLAINSIESLFSLFEAAVEKLVCREILVHFDERGNIVTKVEKLGEHIEEIALAVDSLRAEISAFEPHCVPLPPVHYGASKDYSQDFRLDDDPNEIIKSGYTNGYTYIYKPEGYDTHRLSRYKDILAKSYREKEALQRQTKEPSNRAQEMQDMEYRPGAGKAILWMSIILCSFFIANRCDRNQSQGAKSYGYTAANRTTVAVPAAPIDNATERNSTNYSSTTPYITTESAPRYLLAEVDTTYAF